MPKKKPAKRAAKTPQVPAALRNAARRAAAALAPPEPPPNPVGRPSTYQPEFARQAEFLCGQGATDNDLAEFFEVSERTLNRWKISVPEFAQAITAGKNGPDDRVQRSLFTRAMGFEYEEIQPVKLKEIIYDSDGKKKVSEKERVELVPVVKRVPPDTTAAIFWLKNRRKEDWRDVHQHEIGRPGDFNGWTREQLDQYIADGVKELPAELREQVMTPEEQAPRKLKRIN